MTTQQLSAKIDSGVAAFREWQRGAINWTECMFRMDLPMGGEVHLSDLCQTSDEASVRRAMTAAQGHRHGS